MKNKEKDIIIVPFKNVVEVSEEIIGKKASNLGEVLALRLPVPQGYVITTNAFDYQFELNKISEFIDQELKDLDISDSVRLENASKKIRSKILNIEINDQLKDMFKKAYSSLSGFTDSYVALRSSSPVFDIKNETVSNNYSTYLNVRGKEEVLDKIKYCWASMFSPQNLFSVLSRGIAARDIKLAVIVQKMIQAEVSGIMFTMNPIDNDNSKISIECVLVLGESLMSGQISPDNYLVDKESGKVLEKKILPQNWMLVRKGKTKKGEEPNVKVNVSNIWKVKQKLENKYIENLVTIGKKVEEKLKQPQEIEWVYEGGKLWIIQVRPVTTLEMPEDSWRETPTFAELKAKTRLMSSKDSKSKTDSVQKLPTVIDKPVPTPAKTKQVGKTVLLSGRGVQEGIVSGSVKIINNPSELKNIQRASIIVTSRITPEFDNKLDKVVGIVADKSGTDSYGIILAKSLKIPCIVDTHIATKVLRNLEEITLDGTKGDVIAGATDSGRTLAEKILHAREDKVEKKESEKAIIKGKKKQVQEKEVEVLKTATKVFVNIEDADKSPNISSEQIDGVGRFSPVNVYNEIGVHPQMILKKNSLKKKFQESLVLNLFRVSRSFEPKPVLYRLSDMTSDKYRDLEGGNQFEKQDENPLLGLRGSSRFIEYNDELELELEAIKVIRNKENIRNLWIEIPYVRTFKELKEMKQLISGFGFRRSSTFKLFFTVAVPSTIVRIGKLLELGLDGVVLDLNLLSQLMLGIDSTNMKLKDLTKGTHLSILWAVEKVVKACNKKKVQSIIVGDMVSDNLNLIKKLVEIGVGTVSVDNEVVSEVRKTIYDQETKVLRSKRRR